MTTSVRSLAFSIAILACACTDKTPAQGSEPKPAPSAQVPDTRSATTALMTATAEATPRSIVNAEPKPAPTHEIEEALVVPHAPEPETPAPIDFDRPLAPEEVHVSRFVLSTDVTGREPVGEAESFFTSADKIFAFVEVENREGAPYAFNVHFEPAEGPAFPYGIKLTVPTAERFRTWAFTRIKREPGRYRAVLRTQDGQEIASREFSIELEPDALHDEPELLPEESAAATD